MIACHAFSHRMTSVTTNLHKNFNRTATTNYKNLDQWDYSWMRYNVLLDILRSIHACIFIGRLNRERKRRITQDIFNLYTVFKWTSAWRKIFLGIFQSELSEAKYATINFGVLMTKLMNL